MLPGLDHEPSLFERFASAAALETYLVEDAIEQYANLFGQEGYIDPGFEGEGFPTTPVPIALESVAVADAAATPTSAPTDFSTTNTQINGVDEADLEETDGEFIYQVNDALLTDEEPQPSRSIIKRF